MLQVNDETRLMLLRNTPLGRMPEEVLAEFAHLMELKAFAAGQVLCREGEAGGLFCIVASGLLKAYRSLPSGREITIFLLRSGDSFGFLPLLDGGPFPMTVETMEHSWLLTLGRDVLLDFLNRTPAFSWLLLATLAAKVRECVDRLSVVTSQGAVARTAHALLSLASPAPDERSAVATLPISQVELAQTLGIAPENLSRALTRLEGEGLIRKGGKRRFFIPSLERLRKVAEA